MAKSRREDYHSWTHDDVFPAKLKKLSFGDIFGLFLGFLYDWTGRVRKDEMGTLPNNAVDLARRIVDDQESVVLEADGDTASSVLETWIFQTQAKYTGDKRADISDPFLSLKPVHVDMSRIWPSQYSSDSRVGLQRLYFSLLAYDEKGDLDLGILEDVRGFFSESSAAKIGAFSRIVLSLSSLPAISEQEMRRVRDENKEVMRQESSPPLCRPHARMFRDDLKHIMAYRDSLSHVELMEWLYSCICFHLATYTLRTAIALRHMMEDAFVALEAPAGQSDAKQAPPNCRDCPGIDECPFKPQIPVSSSFDPHQQDISLEPFAAFVSVHKGIILEHPAYLSTLGRLREAAEGSASLAGLVLPHEFVREYKSNKAFRGKTDKLLLVQVRDYIDRVSDIITPAYADTLKSAVSANPALCLRIFKEAVRLYYAGVGSRYDSTAQVWSFYKAAAGKEGAFFLSQKTKDRPDFYLLSVDFLTVMAHIMLAMNPSARITDFLHFMKERGIVLDSSQGRNQLADLITNLQDMGMYVKMSDDVSAQFVYPLYQLRRNES